MNDGERIIKLETQMDNIENKVDEGFDRLEKSQNELKETLKNFIEKSDGKFASKWVEKAAWSVASVIIIAVLGAVIALVIK
jgi:predicted  nucleic acid-binding Zn-ribbon protein